MDVFLQNRQTVTRGILCFFLCWGCSWAGAEEIVAQSLIPEVPLSLMQILMGMMPQDPQESMNVALRLVALLASAVLMKLMMNAQISATNRHYISDLPQHALHRFFAGMTVILKGTGPLILYACCFYGLLNTLNHTSLWQGFEIIGYGIGFYLAADLIVSSFLSTRLNLENRFFYLKDKTSCIVLWIFRSFFIFLILFYIMQETIVRFHIESPVTQSFLQSFVLMGCIYAGVLVLAFRQEVSSWMASRETEEVEDHPENPKSRHFFGYIAHIWHMLAIGAIVASYSMWVHRGSGELNMMTEGIAWTFLALLGSKGLFQLIQRAQRLLVQHQNDEKTPYKERLILERLNIHLPYILQFTKGVILCFAFMIILEGWGIQAFYVLNVHWVNFLFKTILENYIVALVIILSWEIFNVIMNYYMRPRVVAGQQVLLSARTRTLLPILRMVGRVLIILIGGLMVLSTFGVNIAPLIAGLSVFGLAISFGSQTLVKDFVTGLFILLENDIEVGDTVSIGSSLGTVEATTVRNIKLRDPEGALHIIPYSSIAGLINLSRDYTANTLEFTVSHQESVDKVMSVIREVSDDLQKEPSYQAQILAPVMILGVKSISDVGLTILAKLRTKPDPHHLIVLEFYRRIKQKYDEHNIQVPFPKRSVFLHNV